MPATPNYRLPDWREPPALTGIHELKVPERKVYLQSLKDCTEFVLSYGLSEIDAYDGNSELQQYMAAEIAESIFEPERDVIPALRTYIAAQQDSLIEQPPAEVVALRTEYVVTRYDAQTGKILPFARQA